MQPPSPWADGDANCRQRRVEHHSKVNIVEIRHGDMLGRSEVLEQTVIDAPLSSLHCLSVVLSEPEDGPTNIILASRHFPYYLSFLIIGLRVPAQWLELKGSASKISAR